MAYKVGDEVLVRAKLIEKTEDGSWRVQVPANSYTYRVRNSSIHGPAPKPEIDWTKVPMGARVRVRDDEYDAWSTGRYILFHAPFKCPFQVLPNHALNARWYAQCELVEEGDE